MKQSNGTGDVMSKIRGIEEASPILFAHLRQIDKRMQSLQPAQR